MGTAHSSHPEPDDRRPPKNSEDSISDADASPPANPADSIPKDDAIPSEPDRCTGDADSLIALLITLVIILGVLGFVGFTLVPQSRPDELSVVCATRFAPDVIPNTRMIAVEGRVMYKGNPIPNSKVWGIARDDRGNGLSSETVTTDSEGAFKFNLALDEAWFLRRDAPVLRVFATSRSFESQNGHLVVAQPAPGGATDEQWTGSASLALGRGRSIVPMYVDSYAAMIIAALFILSIVVALYQFRNNWCYRRIQFHFSIMMAFLFSLGMILTIGIGMIRVHTFGTENSVLSMGFASIYKGTYVNALGEEWLFSLTSPSALESGLAHGFGAPLWVVFLSVLGAAALTINIIATNVKSPPDIAKFEDVRERIAEIDTHQFYILFAPLGAIFVFQFLVVAEAANNHVTVGLTVLAAGAATNLLLSRAIQVLQGVLTRGNGAGDDRNAGA